MKNKSRSRSRGNTKNRNQTIFRKTWIIGISILFIGTIFVNSSIFGKKSTDDIQYDNYADRNYFDQAFKLNNFDFSDSRSVFIKLNITGDVIGQELLWRANCTGTNYEESAVTYIDGVAYIGSCSNHGAGHDKLFAVNTTNGEILWSTYIGPTYSGPVIDDDVLYIGTCFHGDLEKDTYMYAINRFSGEEIWKVLIYGEVAEPVQFDDDKIYFCTFFDNKKIYALNKINGSVHWTYNTHLPYCANIPMLKDNSLYAAYYDTWWLDGGLFKINATNGHTIWKKLLPPGPWDNSITSDGEDRIFLALYADRTMNAYNDSDGSLIWIYPLHGKPLSFNAYHNGVVFIADNQGYVYALNSTDGTLIWENKIGSIVDISSPTLSGGLLFVGTRDFDEGAFFALDETTGEILWKYTIGSSITAPPTIADGMMMCGTDDWHMYAFDFGIGCGDWILHRYDSWNTAYSPDGLTTWQYVEASCTTENNITTCIVTNKYDHDVVNIILKLNFSGYWYDFSGNLLKSNSDNYTIDSLTDSSSLKLIIAKDPIRPPPNVRIVKPEKAIYLMNKKILSFSTAVIVGKIDIEVEASSSESVINKVEFYIDDELKHLDTVKPYRWMWHEKTLFKFQYLVKVIAYNGAGKKASAEIEVWKFL